MRDISTKMTGDTLTADEFNDIPTEIENAILATGIALSAGDLFQLSKAIANYVANGSFYEDSGVANAYVLDTTGTQDGPTAYFDGMKVRAFLDNANTGASTVNVDGLGVRNIRKNGAVDPLISGDLPVGYVELVFVLAQNAFNIEIIYQATTTLQGKVELATDAEAITGTDAQRAVTPAALDAALTAALTGTVFTAGTKMVFYQAAAPAGWTLDASVNDRALVAVNAGGGALAGSWTISGFTSGATTLTEAQMPAHRHQEGTVHRGDGAGAHTRVFGTAATSQTGNINEHGQFRGDGARGWTQTVGGGGSHSHSLTHNGSWRPSRATVIVCTKN